MSVVTPEQVERRLKELSKLIDEAHDQLVDSEANYHRNKAEYELAMAKSSIGLASKSSPTGKNYTVGERDDNALLDNANEHTELAYAEASVKASKENAKRIQLQVDIARSVAALIRSEMHQ